jgi:YegS/Rv2252/BmrU family lipid kinase
MQSNSARHIALLANHRSGKGKSIQIASRIQSFLHAQSVSSELYSNHWPDSLSPFTDVWIFGGDGTLNYFVNHYPDCKLPLSIFPSGTGNDFAFILYGHQDPIRQAIQVLKAPAKQVDAGSCNGLLFMNGVGLGFDGEVLKSMSQIRKIGGGLGYLISVLRQIFFFREVQFSILYDNCSEEHELLLLLVNNSSRTGGGFLVSPRSTIDDGLLDLVICNPLSVIRRLFYLPKIKEGKHLKLPFVKHLPVQKITILSKQKIYGQLDGELISGDRFEFEIRKNQFLFRY